MPTSGKGGPDKSALVSQYEQKISQMVKQAKETAVSHATDTTTRKGDPVHQTGPAANGNVGKKHIIQTSVGNGARKGAQDQAQ